MNYKPFNLEQAKAGKPVITRDGRPARIVCFDLFMAPEEKTVWVNLWRKDGRITTGEDTYETKEAATDSDWIVSAPGHVGTFPITYQE